MEPSSAVPSVYHHTYYDVFSWLFLYRIDPQNTFKLNATFQILKVYHEKRIKSPAPPRWRSGCPAPG